MSVRALFILVGHLGTAAVVVGLVLRPEPEPDGLGPLRWVIAALMLPGIVRLVVMLTTSPWNDLVQRRRDRAARSATYRPFVSVIVPAWNEEVGIRTTVSSLLASDYPDLEVVVVNDGSTDGTEDVVLRLLDEERARGDRGRTLVYRRQPNAGKARALNHGVRVARGEIIVTVDADSVVEPDAIGRIVDRFADPRVMCVAGNVKIGNPGSVLGTVQRFEYLMGFFSKNADSILGSVYIVGGAAAAYRRSVLEEVGEFAVDVITEDIEMSTRILEAGHRIEYAPRAVVWTEVPSELPGLARQRLRWKHGRLITFFRYRRMFFSVEPRHGRWLTAVALPLALLGDVLLLLQPAAVALAGYSVLVRGDHLPMVVFLVVVAAVVALQVLLDPRRRNALGVLWLAPAAWLPMLVIDAVELQAVVRSVHRLVRGQDLQWQRWQRRGAFDASAGEPVSVDPPRPLSDARRG